jgi:hypothetical protein
MLSRKKHSYSYPYSQIFITPFEAIKNGSLTAECAENAEENQRLIQYYRLTKVVTK